ncbi:hypothetical protein [Salmon gill poxvirus]|uniref:Uncharacterized protein n=1 Tax=Salmon gill poxvirus TaxID=1680908 RepID=A0A0H4Y1C0_9POXV|nr:hypothetical protein AL387_gp093 [Salmon gill poxvirus]AKR04217.1 hypothetical protein SGPV093 [Salmon gill poxvirus]WMX26505.1 hypothetical protein [Salmon gill poxvirus]
MGKTIDIQKNKKTFKGYNDFCTTNILYTNIQTIPHTLTHTTNNEITTKKIFTLEDYVLRDELVYSNLLEKPDSFVLLEKRHSMAVRDIRTILPLFVLVTKAEKTQRILIPSISEIWWIAEMFNEQPYKIMNRSEDVTEEVLFYETSILNRLAHLHSNGKTFRVSTIKNVLMKTLNDIGISLEEMVQ